MKSTRFLAKKNDILSVFSNTATKLEELISSMAKEKGVQVEEREKINTEIETLDIAINESEVLKNRIQDFINPKQDATEKL